MICSKTAITPTTAVNPSSSKKVHMKRANRAVTISMIQSVALAGSLPPGNRMSMYLMLPREDQRNHCGKLAAEIGILQGHLAGVSKDERRAPHK